MNKRMDWYQKGVIGVAVIGLLLIFWGFVQTRGETPDGRMSDVYEVTPDAIEYVDENTVKYIFSFDFSQDERLCLHFISDLENIWIYQNGELLYGLEDGKTLIGSTPGKFFHFVKLPPLQSTITVVSHSQFVAAENNTHSFWVGDRQLMMKERIVDSLPFAVIYFLTFIGGVVLLFYWCMVRKDLKNDKEGLYFSILLITTGVWLIRGSDFVNILFQSPIAFYFMGYVLFLQIPLLFFCFALYYWKIQCRKWIRTTYFAAASANMAVCLTLHLLGIRELKETAIFTHVLLLTAFVTMFYGLFVHWRRHGLDYKVKMTALPVILALLSTLLDYSGFYHNRLDSYKRGGIVILIFVICISVSVLYDLSLQLKEGRRNAIYKKLAVTDLLTGLYNRNAYETWEKEHRSDFSDIHIVLCDLNNLKYYNDCHGHETGDKYIVDAAQILVKAMAGRGSCYRIGGDEFILIFEKISSEEVQECLRQIEALQQEYNLKSDTLNMQIACGYAKAEKKDRSVSEVVKRADSLMYENKSAIKSGSMSNGNERMV